MLDFLELRVERIEGKQLGSQYLHAGDDIGSPVGSIFRKLDEILKDGFSQLLVNLENVGASFLDQPEVDFVHFLFHLSGLFEGSHEHQKRNDYILGGSVTHWVEGAHETEERLQFPLGELPMLRVQEEGKHARNLLTTETERQRTFILVVKATSGILILLQIKDRTLHE